MTKRVNLEHLVELVLALPYGSVLAIEGCSGSGKTTLAKTLQERTGAAAIHIDDFVVSGPEALTYDKRIDYGLLTQQMLKARDNDHGAIVEGICLQVVLAKLNMQYDEAVYVKRISPGGIWHDGLHIKEFVDGNWRALPEPHMSDMRYHAMHVPHLVHEYFYPRFDA